MDLIDVSQKIELKIKQLTELRNELDVVGEERVRTAAEYERFVAAVIIKLKNGVDFFLDGQKISNPPTTVIEKIAKGLSWEHKLAMDTAETKFKNHIQKIQIVMAQLNGYQSINRYISQVEDENA